MFDAVEISTLAAVFDTVVPADSDEGGWEGGGELLLREHVGDFLHGTPPLLRAACRLLDERAAAQHGKPFRALGDGQRTAIFADALRHEETGLREKGPEERPLDAIVDLVFHAYYGGTREPAGWSVAGFRELPDGVTPVEPQLIEGIRPASVANDYDVIVVGGGAGGGIAAMELAERGKRVLLMERSRPFRNSELRGNHLQGKRLELYEVTAGPGAGSPRVLENLDGSTELLPGNGSGIAWGLVAMALGGGTRVWQAMSWRFTEEDFAMASTYGVPEDSTLADWPFSYEELEPYYERAEWVLGVSGDSRSSAATRSPRKRDLPMPVLRDNGMRATMSAAATRLGWVPTPIPLAINSVPRDGRAACVGCSQCVGHACPVDAKNGSHNTAIPRALATGNCDLMMSTQVVEILHDQRGAARGVRAFHEDADGTITELTIPARQIVISAGAMETPRLILASGLGNHWVGRNHHSHGGAAAYTVTADVGREYIGPGHSVATLDFIHRGGAPWGGGVIFDLPITLPAAKATMGRRVAASFGLEHKQWMRESSVPLGAMSMLQEIPHRGSWVSIDPLVRDRFGMPVARLRGEAHPATAEAADFMRDRCVEWVTELGGRDLMTDSYPGGSRGAEHSAGTARMGHEPGASACDPQGRLHGTSNVYIADASLHPTNGGFNPGLTAMANALRVAALMP